MGVEDIVGKAQAFLADARVSDALKSEQAENISDKLLDGAAGVANDITGGKFQGQVQGARDAADTAIGSE